MGGLDEFEGASAAEATLQLLRCTTRSSIHQRCCSSICWYYFLGAHFPFVCVAQTFSAVAIGRIAITRTSSMSSRAAREIDTLIANAEMCRASCVHFCCCVSLCFSSFRDNCHLFSMFGDIVCDNSLLLLALAFLYFFRFQSPITIRFLLHVMCVAVVLVSILAIGGFTTQSSMRSSAVPAAETSRQDGPGGCVFICGTSL